jgi:hypothetical protein
MSMCVVMPLSSQGTTAACRQGGPVEEGLHLPPAGNNYGATAQN